MFMFKLYIESVLAMYYLSYKVVVKKKQLFSGIVHID
jgi:hypothetical protein